MNTVNHKHKTQCPYCGSDKITLRGWSKPVKAADGEKRRRFQCAKCNKYFSCNTLSINYRYRHKDQQLNQKIFSLLINGLAERGISRLLGVSLHCVSNRLRRLSRRAFEFQSLNLSKLQNTRIKEDFVYDGLQNFSYSQFNPNNINHIVGSDSLFTYDFSFAPLNRSGFMSPRQRELKMKIESEKGRYHPSAIRTSTSVLLSRISQLFSAQTLRILSDEHWQYKKSIRIDLAKVTINHKCISSRCTRNYKNILFPINHSDMLIRHFLRSFTRETIAFSKKAASMCQKFVLYLVYKNYMRPQFTRDQKYRPRASKESPAQYLGLSDKLMTFYDIFFKRPDCDAEKSLSPEWKCFFNCDVPAWAKRVTT